MRLTLTTEEWLRRAIASAMALQLYENAHDQNPATGHGFSRSKEHP